MGYAKSPVRFTGLTWDGMVPEPQPNHRPMTQDLIDLNLTPADWTAIDAALTTLENTLGAALLDLTPE